MYFVLQYCERTALRSSERSAKRDATTKSTLLNIQQKMAAKFGFSMIGIRDFLRDPKKYTFGKSIFKTFCKNRKTEILPPFLSTLDSWMDMIWLKMVSANGGPKKFFYARTLRVLAPHTTNQYNYDLICNRIDDSLL